MFEPVLETLISFYEFDLWVFTRWWMYAPLLIPIAFYLTFFFIKWTVLTAPIWLPFVIIAGSLPETKQKPTKEEKHGGENPTITSGG